MTALQGSLLTLADDVGPRRPVERPRRLELAGDAWIDVHRGWMAGADELFERLVGSVPWRAARRRMYDRVVDVPRLTAFYDEAADAPDPALAAARDALDRSYGAVLGEPFCTIGLALSRDGGDSVAWHGDTIGRGSTDDTIVAVLSLGSPWAFLLRPRGGGRSGGRALRFVLAGGDLLVMGGSCQRTWEHAVPKTRRPVGPRVSAQFRAYDVR